MFKFQMHRKSLSAGAPPLTPLGSLRPSPRLLYNAREGKTPSPLFPLNAFGVSIARPSHWKFLATPMLLGLLSKCDQLETWGTLYLLTLNPH